MRDEGETGRPTANTQHPTPNPCAPDTEHRVPNAEVRRVGVGLLFRVFLSVGLQSFGGGASTFALMQRTIVEKRAWVSEAEFTRDNSLCQLAPGINLFALTTLIGRKLGGAAGIAACLLGLLLPSVAITIVMTAAYVRFETSPALRPALNAAMRGVVPALVGIGLVTAGTILRPLLAEGRRQGWAGLLLAAVILAGSAAALLRWPTAVVPVLVAAGAVGATARAGRARPAGAGGESEPTAAEAAAPVGADERQP